MTTTRKWMVSTAVAGAAVAVIFVTNRAPVREVSIPNPSAANPGGEVRFLMEQQWRIRLKLARVEAARVAPQIVSTGRVVPAAGHQAVIAPPVGGILGANGFPRVGQRVQSGQVLATLTQTPTAAEAAQLRVENVRLEAERRRLANSAIESRVRLDLARTEFERASRLYDKKAYALRQVEVAEAEFKAAEAGLAAATEQLGALDTGDPAAVAYPLRAPISGVIVAVHKSAGEQVNAGEPVFELVNLDTVWIEVPIFEHDLGRLDSAGEAAFATLAYPDTEFRGKLVDVGAVIDERTRAATARFEVANSGHRLRIGMQANARLNAARTIDAVLIPKEAVLDNEGEKIVYVLLSGETFQRRTIQLGDEYGDKVAVVLSGLQPGERVVTQGAYQLKLQELRPADAGAHSHEV